MKNLVVAIDGPAGAGKTTVSKIVADRLGVNYCDSGSCYRAICYLALSQEINPSNSNLLSLLEKKEIILDSGKVFVDSEDLTPHLREPEVSANVSIVAKNPEVRKYITSLLVSQNKKKGLVIEGRDIGSVLFPGTPFKFYLDAHLSLRTERRGGEAIEERDRIDRERQTAPLIKPPDSLLINTNNMLPEKVADRIIEKIRFGLGKNTFYSVVKMALHLFFKIYFRLSIEGKENVPQYGAIVAMNHLSFLDPPIVGVAIQKRQLHYFAKEELFSIPFLSWLIKRLNSFSVKREGFSREAIEKAVRILENNGMVLVFPEGTRGEDLREPKKGIGLIASLANKKIRTSIPFPEGTRGEGQREPKKGIGLIASLANKK
ncbi:(d)CMP kinase, partial [bacterium]|nr:(d)CMP kinase [bacterium]